MVGDRLDELFQVERSTDLGIWRACSNSLSRWPSCDGTTISRLSQLLFISYQLHPAGLR